MPKNFIESKSKMWNLWHGCHKLSLGCQHCYVYRGDAKRDIDSATVVKTKSFDLPIQKKRNGDYKIPSEHWSILVLRPISFWKMLTIGVLKRGI